MRQYGEGVPSRCQGNSDGDAALENALYGFLRSGAVEGLGFDVDGWLLFQVTIESADMILGVGIMASLSGGELPLKLELSRDGTAIRYKISEGADCERWFALTKSKRWNAVYLYATGGREVCWSWSDPISGRAVEHAPYHVTALGVLRSRASRWTVVRLREGKVCRVFSTAWSHDVGADAALITTNISSVPSESHDMDSFYTSEIVEIVDEESGEVLFKS